MSFDGRALPRPAVHGGLLLLLAAALAGPAACGKKGPPLAPLRLVPDTAGSIAARRVDDRVYLQFALPARNAAQPGAVNLGRLDIYAMTIAPGAPLPPVRELLDKRHVIGRIDVKPPLDEDASEAEQEQYKKDARPAPGDTATFSEAITAAQLEPVPASAPAAAPSAPSAPPAQAGAAAAPAAPVPSPPHPLERVYVLQGVSREGRSGTASAPIAVAMVPPPLPPSNVVASFTQTAVGLKWDPHPPVSSGTIGYNVYAPSTADGSAAPAPLNAQPLTTASFQHGGAEAGVKQCFVVRAVEKIGVAPVESAASAPACVTPRDVFPPAPPARLAVVAGPGAINLIWDPNSEADLAGYLVLRGEAGSDTLQPLTPEPIRETTYRDATVTAGVRYAYAVVAVDRAVPPNRSAPSARVEETAR